MPYPMDPRARMQEILKGMFGPSANIIGNGQGAWKVDKKGRPYTMTQDEAMTLGQKSDMAEKLRKRTRKTIAQSGTRPGSGPGNNPMSYLFRG